MSRSVPLTCPSVTVSFWPVQRVFPHRQLVGKGDVVIIATVAEGVTVHKHHMHVGAALGDAAQQLRRLQLGAARGKRCA